MDRYCLLPMLLSSLPQYGLDNLICYSFISCFLSSSSPLSASWYSGVSFSPPACLWWDWPVPYRRFCWVKWDGRWYYSGYMWSDWLRQSYFNRYFPFPQDFHPKSTVYFLWSILYGWPDHAHTVSEDALSTSLRNKGGGTLLLIVEDNMDLMEYLVSVLKPDYKIITAKTGDRGVDNATRSVPDTSRPSGSNGQNIYWKTRSYMFQKWPTALDSKIFHISEGPLHRNSR